MTTATGWCRTCGNPVQNGQCFCWGFVAQALEQYLGMDFDASAELAAKMWAATSDEDKEYVWANRYAEDHTGPGGEPIPVYEPPAEKETT